MRLKLDENLPASLAISLSAMGHDVDTAIDEGLAGHDDGCISQATQAARRFLLTQDLDFSDARMFVPGTHAGLLILRLNHPSRQIIFDRLIQIFATESVDSWTGCVVVATQAKIRIRRS